jgi:hypothetical protein
MSRTEEDIASGVDITIMRDATLSAYPASYSEVCDTFRPRLAGARRTDSGRERFIHFLIPSPVRRRFIAEHVSEGRPACIENRLRQAGLGESGGIHIADRDVIELSNDTGREFMVKVTSGIDNARVEVGCLPSFPGPLGSTEFVSQLPQKPRVLDLLPIGQSSEVFKAQVDANTAPHRPRLGLSDFNDNVQEPIPACIAGEVRSVLDLAVRQRPREEYPKGVPGKAKGIPLALKISAFQRHPAQRSPAPPAQERAVLLTARLGVLFTHGIDGARVQGEFLAASRRQPIEIKTGRPALIPFQRLLLSLVTKIPDEVTGASLSVEQSSQRFDAVSIDQQHRRKLMGLRPLDKTLKPPETLIFSALIEQAKAPMRSVASGSARYTIASGGELAMSEQTGNRRRPHPKERHFLPGSSAGVSVPKRIDDRGVQAMREFPYAA